MIHCSTSNQPQGVRHGHHTFSGRIRDDHCHWHRLWRSAAWHLHRRLQLSKQLSCRKGPAPKPAIERFWAKVERGSGSACWIWCGHVNSKTGYGMFTATRQEQPVGAHRYAWMSLHGPLTSADFVCHTCDNRKCCNPAHLYKGDAQSNAVDMISRGRMRHGPRAKGEASPTAKLTNTNAATIRHLHKTGVSGMELARQFNVGRTTIGRIVANRTYRCQHGQ